MSIQQNQALFALLGVMYGGNGTTTFMLPDLRGRAPLGSLSSRDPSWQPTPVPQGSAIGAETITLTAAQVPAHTHAFIGTNAAAANGAPSSTEVLATSPALVYGSPQNLVPLSAGPLSATGASPHENVQPSAVVNMCIALNGSWPSRN